MRAWWWALALGCAGGPDELVDPCGDAAVADGEACDDGVNDGSYGGCMPGCRARAPYCGDGAVDEGEACDDGVNDGSYGSCAYDCAAAGPSCGDGQTNGPEACDDGVNDGSYGGCKPGCLERGPRCGDGRVTAAEVCDDGVNDGLCGSCLSDCSGVVTARFLVELTVRAVPDAWGWPADLTPDLFVEVFDEAGHLLYVTETVDDRDPPVVLPVDGLRVDGGVLVARAWDEDGGAFGDADYLGEVSIDTSIDVDTAALSGTRVSWRIEVLPCD
ncbi:MAG TPA: hypothetical protein PKA64_06210 [Myxococcota bacterium]|nr:hypothetical protein [Myxococcota bacterium]